MYQLLLTLLMSADQNASPTRPPTRVLIVEALHTSEAQKFYQTISHILSEPSSSDIECESDRCHLLGPPELMKVFRPRDPKNPPTDNPDFGRILLGMIELPEGWIMAEEMIRPQIMTVMRKPWERSRPELPPAADTIAGSHNSPAASFTFGAKNGPGPWVPARDVVGGTDEVERLSAALATGQPFPCASFTWESGDCVAVQVKGENGGRGIGICRTSPSLGWATGSCTLAALAVDNAYWLQAQVGPPTIYEHGECCGESFYEDFPCAIDSLAHAVAAVKAALARAPISLSASAQGNAVRGVAAWRPSRFLGGSWREQFALTIYVGATGPLGTLGYIAEINYVIKTGASPETEEMHLPNEQQKETVYTAILDTLQKGVQEALCKE